MFAAMMLVPEMQHHNCWALGTINPEDVPERRPFSSRTSQDVEEQPELQRVGLAHE